ncbi:MAG: ATP-grasp domain-containing protein [Planctomycetaceae bacterium]|nr:ATP-grasp domain-containing protein [Planctomycetaceae bacterium]
MLKPPRLPPPEFVLSDFYPANCVLNSRHSFQSFGWLTANLPGADFRTGAALTINGSLPVICSAGVCSPRTNYIFELAGLPENSHRIIYQNQSGFESLLDECQRRKQSVIFQHQFPEQERPRELYWIDPDLLGHLNNKAYLHEFVPEPYVPERTIFPVSELSTFLSVEATRPLVLKGGANLPTGGGISVCIIRTDQDLEKARERLQIGEQVVAERFLSIEKNYCVNFGTDGQQVRLLGCCEQITNESGQYSGNWLSLVDQPPAEVIEVGYEIMQTAAKRGYVGVAGFDIVRESSGKILVIDLNFRLNGSTPGLLWQNRVLTRSGSRSVGRIVRLSFPLDVDPEFTLLRELTASGWFFPQVIYDPEVSQNPLEEVRVLGILFGHSRDQVERRLQRIHRKFQIFTQAPSKSQQFPPISRAA